MDANTRVDPRQFHHVAVLVDLHAHPGIKAMLFNRDLARRFGISRPAFWPHEMRTNFDRLRADGVDVMLSAATVPERPLLEGARRYSPPRSCARSRPAARCECYGRDGGRK